jgi:hypothetical protein
VVGNCKIIILIDDSTSMTNKAYDQKFLNKYNRSSYSKIYYDSVYNRYVPCVNPDLSRFDELKSMTKYIINASTILSNDPVSLYFMNSNNKTDVNVNSNIDHLFPVTPNGRTPTLE